MGVPRVWAIKRDHGAPLGKRGTHGGGLVVARAGVLVVGGVVVPVATTAATTAYYPDGVPRPPRAVPECVVCGARPWGAVGGVRGGRTGGAGQWVVASAANMRQPRER